MRSNRLPFLLSLLPIVAACDQATPTVPVVETTMNSVVAAGQKTRLTESEEIPIDETFYFDCAGEEIHFTGTTYQKITTVDNGDGTFVQRVQIRGAGALSGIGLTTGNRYHYQAVGTGIFDFDFNEGDAFVRQIVHGVIASSGPHSPNFRVMQLFTVTVTDGGYELDIRLNEAICR